MIHASSWTTTLPIMVMGMVGIFIVITVIILAVMLLSKLTEKKDTDSKDDQKTAS